MLIGYARTSTTDQQAGFDSQLVELEAYGSELTFKEQVSAVASRGELDRAIDMLSEGDKLVLTKLDRLARNVMHMGELQQQIEAKGAGLVILSLGSETIDTTTAIAIAIGKLIVNMMVSVAQFEREMMKERQVEGIKRAKAEGKYKARVPTAMRQADKVKALVEAGVQRVQVHEHLGISKASYYRCLSG